MSGHRGMGTHPTRCCSTPKSSAQFFDSTGQKSQIRPLTEICGHSRARDARALADWDERCSMRTPGQFGTYLRTSPSAWTDLNPGESS
jgi:hypothetical protein